MTVTYDNNFLTYTKTCIILGVAGIFITHWVKT